LTANAYIGPAQCSVAVDPNDDMAMVGLYRECRDFNGKHIGEQFQPIQNLLPSMVEILLRIFVIAT